MSSANKCLLRSVTNSHSFIELPHNQKIALGRNPLTQVVDKRCSREQVIAIADYSKNVLSIKQVGNNDSGANGKPITKNKEVLLQHGDRLELLVGYHIYRVEFDPPPRNIVKEAQLRQTSEEPPAKRPHLEAALNGSHSNSVKVEELVVQKGQWHSIKNSALLIYDSPSVESRSKIAAFDLDGTLILTKSGKVFPVDRYDWKFFHPDIVQKLRKLWSEENYKIVVFTNQNGLGKSVQTSAKTKEFQLKVEKVVEELKIPVQVFAATQQDIFRKPAPGMWNVLVKEMNSGIEIDMGNSFYVGDAAGRNVNWAPHKSKDFSAADRLFALNLGLIFYTPEEYFFKQFKAPYSLPAFNPRDLSPSTPVFENTDDKKLFPPHQEIIIMVGAPGSGKSFFVKNYLVPNGYAHISRDNLGTWQKCVSVMIDAIHAGQSAVIDNTNPDKESRERYISTAQKFNVPCRVFEMNVSKEQSKHNNKFRQFTDSNHIPVNEIIINSFFVKYEAPSVDEGVEDILKVNFVPKFEDPQQEILYKMYLI
ncbi:unnamed protein product [Bemisia tabaci]|uniref:PNK FHA domain-containing protein n=1 Tax=Bemisia tabaci TaxID=7038 RepID=A0A9P0ACP3_BEMTA|nr:unnamed protein product [Bemisia tabaci]